MGSLKEWPLHEAPERRSVAMICGVHRKCSIVRRRPVTNVMLLRWLFSAEIPPANTCDADMAIYVQQHKAAWALEHG